MAKVETERFFGKKGIIIMIRDGNKFTSAIFKDKKNADKFNRNNPADVKKLVQLAKKTKFPKAIDEDKSEFKDTEGAMAKSQLERSMKYANMIYKIIDNVGKGGEVSFPAWVQTKMTKSMDYLQSVYNYLDGKDGLDDKFQENIDRNFRTYADDEGDDEGPVDENHIFWWMAVCLIIQDQLYMEVNINFLISLVEKLEKMWCMQYLVDTVKVEIY